jgi:hypothetical protein|tara:strand:+ start:1616 stop:1918 length:303 start_codon:yes stop_codon:yes gene_type:complete
MIELHEAPALYEKLIHYNEAKEDKVYLSINTFRDVEYLSLRKYYLDFDETWKPTREGISMPLDFTNSKALFEGLVEILSLSEVKGILETHFKETLDELYQ